MSTALISLEEAKRHLLMDHDDDDAEIQQKIEEASAIVLDYLKLSSVPASWQPAETGETGGTGSTPTGGTPPLIRSAVKIIVGDLYKNRESENSYVLTEGVRSLLHRQRHPAMA